MLGLLHGSAEGLPLLVEDLLVEDLLVEDLLVAAARDGGLVASSGGRRPTGALLNGVEVAAHTWDLARSVGAETSMDEDTAQHLLAFARTLPLDDLRAAG